MTYDGDRLTKVTKIKEVISYRKIFCDEKETSLTKLRPFVPKFYGAEINENDSDKCTITIENLLYGKEKGSSIDIKLGTSTLTSGKENQPLKVAERDVIDELITCSGQYGFTICGMNLKDPVTGAPRGLGKVGKGQPPRSLDEAEDYFEKFFQSNQGEID